MFPPLCAGSPLKRQASSERRSSAPDTLSQPMSGVENGNERIVVSMKYRAPDWKGRQMVTSESVEIDDLTTVDSITRKHIDIIEPVSRFLSSSRHIRSSQGEKKRVTFIESNVNDSAPPGTNLHEVDTVISTMEERQRSSSWVSPSTFSKSNQRVSRTLSLMPSKPETSKEKMVWYPAAEPPSPTSQETTQEVKCGGLTLTCDRLHELEPFLPGDRDSTSVFAGTLSDHQRASLSTSPSTTASIRGTASAKNAPSAQAMVQPFPLRNLRSSPSLLGTSAVEYPYEMPSLESASRTTADRLSVLHCTNSDSEVRERYKMACRLLKSALIERDFALQPSEKVFLEGLLREDAASAVSTAQLSAVESAANTLLSDSIFRVGSIDTESFDKAQDMLNTTGEIGLTAMVEGEDPEPEKKIESWFASFDSRNYPFLILGADMKGTNGVDGSTDGKFARILSIGGCETEFLAEVSNDSRRQNTAVITFSCSDLQAHVTLC